MPRNPPVKFLPVCPNGLEQSCRICNVTKPLSQFTKHTQVIGGWGTECLDCARIRTSAYRNSNLEKVRVHDRERSKRAPRLEELRKLSANYKFLNPEKAHAHQAVRGAIESGRLKRLPCVVCGNPKSAGHHEDYSKPLKVIWLCYAHHKQLHEGTLKLP
jgi:hypothetical protein